MTTYQVRHKTVYRYSESVSNSLNVAHLQARNFPGQELEKFELHFTPEPISLTSNIDHFGNHFHFFRIEEPHESFEIISESRVTTGIKFNMDELDGLAKRPWETVVNELNSELSSDDREAVEYSLASPMVPLPDFLNQYVKNCFIPGRKLGEAITALMLKIHRDFRFQAGVTNLATPLEMVFEARCGVCQDFSHLMIGCLRTFGLAARYVSGYLETKPPPGKPKLEGADASHAWVSVYLGKGRWMAYDPTNKTIPFDQHITLAWGRDFSDISPLRGVLFGGGKQSLKVSVDVLRLG